MLIQFPFVPSCDRVFAGTSAAYLPPGGYMYALAPQTTGAMPTYAAAACPVLNMVPQHTAAATAAAADARLQ